MESEKLRGDGAAPKAEARKARITGPGVVDRPGAQILPLRRPAASSAPEPQGDDPGPQAA